MTANEVIRYIGFYLLGLNIILYLIGFVRNNRAYKIFTVYLLCLAVIQYFMADYASRSQNNHFLSTYYFISQFVLLSLFYLHLFKVKALKKLVKYLLIIGVVLLGVQYALNPGLYLTFNSIGILCTSMMLIVYTVIYFYRSLSEKMIFPFVNGGLFIYLISSTLIFATATSFITFGKSIDHFMWRLNGILVILYYLLIVFEWWKNYFPKKTK